MAIKTKILAIIDVLRNRNILYVGKGKVLSLKPILDEGIDKVFYFGKLNTIYSDGHLHLENLHLDFYNLQSSVFITSKGRLKEINNPKLEMK